jgi:hypothetical protein
MLDLLHKLLCLPQVLRWYLILMLCLFFNNYTKAQCMSVPVPLETRILKSSIIVSGKIVSKHSFKTAEGNIYTLNIIDPTAYLKGQGITGKLGVLTYGGILESEAQITTPALELLQEDYGVFFLESNKTGISHPNFRDVKQYFAYADAQGAILYQMGYYTDALSAYKADEKAFFERIQSFTHQPALTPGGEQYIGRKAPISSNSNARIFAITSFSPVSTRAGTIVPGDFLTISGAAFGATAGTVFFSNADDGGATFTSSGVASDIIAWSDNSITVKVPPRAGTGPININGAMTSATSLTVDYAHLSIQSIFSGFAGSTRQRYYLRNMNSAGGYTFSLNTTSGFAGDAAAVAAFGRALQTWSCNTAINWQVGGTTATTFADDNENVVLYDATLPVGVLARATSRFSGSANGLCNLANTVWYLREIDIQAQAIPLAGYTWEKTTAAPSFSEYDFESVMLHELGHAHGLGHRNASGQNMNWAISNGTAIRTLNVNEINAGLTKMAYSTTATCFNPAGSGTPMTAYNTALCSGVLPVELLHFDATPQGEEVRLHWETASEYNNHYFTVERSSDGVQFEEVIIVYGKGNSAKLQEYTTTDSMPYEGIFYYRLKQTDFDGTFSYSDIVSVKRENTAPLSVQYFPNPASDVLHFLPSGQETYQVRILAVNGMQMYASEKTSGFSINLSSWPSGMYLVEVMASEGKQISKLIK